MKLLVKEAKKICEDYKLGKYKAVKAFSMGLANDCYKLASSNGVFVVKVLGYEMDEWMKGQLPLEFEILNYLEKNNFGYRVPSPILNNRGGFLSKVGGKKYWVYEMIDGEVRKDLTRAEILKLVKVIATYHKVISKSKIKCEIKDDSWLMSEYERLGRIKPRNKIDELFFSEYDDFKKILSNFLSMKFNKKLVLCHNDFHSGNIVFNKKKIVGVLDFDNVECSPRIKDLVQLMKRVCLKKSFDRKLFDAMLNEYDKVSKLLKVEREMIFYYLLYGMCNEFWFVYSKMRKKLDKREEYLKFAIKRKNILKEEMGL